MVYDGRFGFGEATKKQPTLIRNYLIRERMQYIQGKIIDWQVDVVMCIDGSSSMIPFMDELKKNVVSFYQTFMGVMRIGRRYVSQLRIKVIVFRDYGCDDEPMVESKFFTLPDEDDAFRSFVISIEAKGGGNGAENALEAIALALKSDWTAERSRLRHAIFVFSNSQALPLEERKDSPSYPEGMPEDFDQLWAWWHGTDNVFNGSFIPKRGQLITFAPKGQYWDEFVCWNGCFSFFSAFSSDFDMGREIMAAISMLFEPLHF